MRSLVFCDVETSGLDSDKHRILEIAVCRVHQGDWNNVGIYTWKFKLSEAAYAEGSPEAYKVNGYRPNHKEWKNAPVIDTEEAKEAYKKILRHLKGAVFVNQNAPFDIGFIQAEMTRCGLSYEPEEVWEVRDFSGQILEKKGQTGRSLHPAHMAAEGFEMPEHRSECDVFRAIWVVAVGNEWFPGTWTDRPEICSFGMKRFVQRKVVGFASGDLFGKRSTGGNVWGLVLNVSRGTAPSHRSYYVDVSYLPNTGVVTKTSACACPKKRCSGTHLTYLRKAELRLR